MTRKLVLPTLVLAAAFAAACSQREAPQAPAQADPSQALKSALDTSVTAIFREAPEFATTLAVSEDLAGGKYSDRLNDYSSEGLARQLKVLQDSRAALDGIDREKLAPADQVTYDVVATAVDDMNAGRQFGYGTYGFTPPRPYVVTQIDGAYVEIPDFLDSQHQVKNEQDARDYLARLKAFGTVLDQETARIKADADKGVIPPDFVIDGAVKQLQAFASLPPADTVLVQSLKRKVETANLPPERQKELAATAEATVKDAVLPAYRRQIEQFNAIRPKATHDAGAWRLPNGAQLYTVALRNWNTTTLTPDQIHDMGLKLIEQLHTEMDAILDAQGLTKGSVAGRVQKVAADPKQLYPNTDAGRAELLRALNQQIADLQPMLEKNFGQLAQAKLDIRRVPPYIEAGAPGGYYQSPALDGSRPGAYYINLRDTAEWPKFTLPTLTYHEGNPGHHWQSATAQESKGLHLLRSAILDFSGYSEGWGLYSEQLADEMGAYEKDPLGRLGYLQSMAFRAARLVVDTGLHHKKWSREQAIDYMVEVTGDQRSSITTEVERYSVWPGQATAYMVGRETINRLRENARAKLGDRFDIKGFHDVVLTNGAMPLSVLERVVDDWVKGRLRAER
jgi:uncharacterized protein (DUF885 family)